MMNIFIACTIYFCLNLNGTSNEASAFLTHIPFANDESFLASWQALFSGPQYFWLGEFGMK
jgi:hypothetical protein